ncbi:MAG TPA: glycosyltransferase [Xanthobacteraceae bacterium]|nr:glycosyltransferase [Xanthobacteraceae bacterium]
MRSFIIALWLSMAAFYFATVLVTLLRYRKPRLAAASPPPCSVALPIKGNSEFLEGNLRALAELEPFRGEILIAVAREDDPAVPLVRRVIAANPERMKLLIGEDASFVNPKLRNVAKAYDAAREEIILFLDDSVGLNSELHEELLHGLQPGVVAVTAAPRGEDARNFFAAIEAASCNGYLFRIQMFLEMFGLAAAFGNAFAFRKRDLESVGGLKRLQEGPCEDSAIATALRETGGRLTMLRSGVRRRIGRRSWDDIYLRHLRWANCTKVHDPLVFVIEPLLGGLFFNLAGAYVVSGAFSISAAAALLLCMGAWYGAEALLHLRCGWPLSALSPFAWIARDLLQPIFMLCARFVRRVVWRGEIIEMRR